jgi:twitching motility protein PilT
MSKPAPVPLLGRIAVQARLINMDQLAEATAEQGRRSDGTPLGDILVEKGLITPRQLAALLRKQQEIAARQRAAPAPAAAPPSRLDAAPLEALLRDAVARGASDVHVHAGAPPKFRVGGVLEEVGSAPLEPSSTERLLLAALGESDRAQLAQRGELDLCHAIPGLGRFRANFFRQQRGLDAVFRFIPPQPPSLAELGLPSHLARHTNYHQGMVLVTGPTGCGKTSTLAALVDLINEERREHILTIEDPIEFIHPAKRCLVNQRSVERHTSSFARALRAALREDPDVIVIGELRDLETISLALTAAETGHLVLGTLHTRGSIRTVNRLVGAFPSDQQDQVRTMLSESLRAVVSQRLLRRADGGGRVAALETLVVNKAVENLIRENKTFQIHSILQTGSSQGMSLLDQSIRQLVQTGVVAREEALRHCEDPRSLGA